VRFRDGFLARCTEPEAIASLFRMLGGTPQGSWAGCPRFGLRDLLEDARARPEQLQRAVEQANLALEDLGILRFRVQNIRRDDDPERGSMSLTVTLVSTDDAVSVTSIRLDR